MQMAQVENEQELRQVSLHPFFFSLSRFDSSKIPNPLPPPFPSLSEPALRAAGQSGGIPRRAMRTTLLTLQLATSVHARYSRGENENHALVQLL